LPELLRRHDASVARYDAVIGIDQNRVRKAEFSNARCYLRDLLLAMRPAIARVWYQRFCFDVLNRCLGHFLPSLFADSR
jgi:hypothetical protein